MRESALQNLLNRSRAFPLAVQYGRTFSGRWGLASVEMVMPRAKTSHPIFLSAYLLGIWGVLSSGECSLLSHRINPLGLSSFRSRIFWT